jgi:hypothetical protein
MPLEASSRDGAGPSTFFLPNTRLMAAVCICDKVLLVLATQVKLTVM